VSPASVFRFPALGGFLLSAGIAWGAPADSAHSYPIHKARRWLPNELSLGAQAGAQYSRIRATDEYRSLLEPVPAEDRPWIGASVGGFVSIRWRSGFSLSLSPRRESYGLRTVEDTVAFAGNPYPHTLRARAEIGYNVWPLMAGYDRVRGRHRVRIQAGLYQAFLSDSRIEWTVDGERSARIPPAAPREDVAGGAAAIEYGFRYGPGECIGGLEYQRAFDPALTGLRGSARTDAVQLRVAYAWTVWREH
jgi:hypothetical protein